MTFLTEAYSTSLHSTDGFVSKSWVAGNVTSLQQARIVVLLEDHNHTIQSPCSPHLLLQKQFRPQDILLLEMPVNAPFSELKDKVKAKFNLDVDQNQVKGWDNPQRWELWPSYAKLFENLDKIPIDATLSELQNSFQKIINNVLIPPTIREEAIREFNRTLIPDPEKKGRFEKLISKITSQSGKIFKPNMPLPEDRKTKVNDLIGRVQNLTLLHFRQSTFSKSQESMIATISNCWNDTRRVWVVAGYGHGDPLGTSFPLEVDRLHKYIGQKPFAVLNPTRLQPV